MCIEVECSMKDRLACIRLLKLYNEDGGHLGLNDELKEKVSDNEKKIVKIAFENLFDILLEEDEGNDCIWLASEVEWLTGKKIREYEDDD